MDDPLPFSNDEKMEHVDDNGKYRDYNCDQKKPTQMLLFIGIVWLPSIWITYGIIFKNIIRGDSLAIPSSVAIMTVLKPVFLLVCYSILHINCKTSITKRKNNKYRIVEFDINTHDRRKCSNMEDGLELDSFILLCTLASVVLDSVSLVHFSKDHMETFYVLLANGYVFFGIAFGLFVYNARRRLTVE
jgi:hypothetical protein